MSERNKAIARRFNEEVLGRLNTDNIDELCAPDCIVNGLPFGVPPTLEGAKCVLDMYAAAFTDSDDRTELLFAAGDMVFVRHTSTLTHSGEMLGIPATGKQVTMVGHRAYRIVNGKIMEFWGLPDAMGLMQQLGGVPLPIV